MHNPSNVKRYEEFVGLCLGPPQQAIHILAWMLMLEAAELGNEIKRIHTRDEGVLTDDRRQRMILEMGDLYYYLTAMMTHIGVGIDVVKEANVRKLEERYGDKARILTDDPYGYSPVPDVP